MAAIRNLALRCRVRWVHWELDERLARGVDPSIDPALQARAEQLVSIRHRRGLAAAIERIVDEADAAPRPGLSIVIGTAHDQVAEARTSLLFLAHLLRHAEPIGSRGVAIIDRLLTDGRSVLYVGGVRGEVALRVQIALECLVGAHNATPEAWFAVPDGDREVLAGR